MNKEDTTQETTKPMAYDALLTTGFSEDDFIEGVFLIEAENEEQFFDRKNLIHDMSEFCDGGFDSWEEDEEGGLYKAILSAYYPSVALIKKAWEEMTDKYEWLFKEDSTILFEGLELWSGGKWLL